MKKLVPVLIVGVILFSLVTDFTGTVTVFREFGNAVGQAVGAVVRAFKAILP